MPKVIYTGPGDSITVDGITIEKGKSAEVTPDQLARLRMTPDAELQVTDAPDTADDRARIRADQDATRDKAANAAARAAAAPTTKKGA